MERSCGHCVVMQLTVAFPNAALVQKHATCAIEVQLLAPTESWRQLETHGGTPLKAGRAAEELTLGVVVGAVPLEVVVMVVPFADDVGFGKSIVADAEVIVTDEEEEIGPYI